MVDGRPLRSRFAQVSCEMPYQAGKAAVTTFSPRQVRKGWLALGYGRTSGHCLSLCQLMLKLWVAWEQSSLSLRATLEVGQIWMQGHVNLPSQLLRIYRRILCGPSVQSEDTHPHRGTDHVGRAVLEENHNNYELYMVKMLACWSSADPYARVLLSSPMRCPKMFHYM